MGQVGQGLPPLLERGMSPFQDLVTGGYSDFLRGLPQRFGGVEAAERGISDVLGRLGGAYDYGMESLGRARDLAQRGLTGAEMGIGVMNRFMPGFERMAGEGSIPTADIIRRLQGLAPGMGMEPFTGALSEISRGGLTSGGLLQDLINRGMGARPDALLGDVTGSLRDMLQTGAPISVSPAFEAMRGVMQRNLADQLAAQQEQYGTSGRFSTAAQQGAERLRERGLQEQNALIADLTRQSEEAARQRQLAAGGLMSQIGQFQSMLPLEAISRVSPLAQTLTGLPLEEARTRIAAAGEGGRLGLGGQESLVRALLGAGQLGLGQGQLQLEAGRTGAQSALGALSAYAPYIDMARQTELAGSRLPTDLLGAQLPFLQTQAQLPMQLSQLMANIYGQAAPYGMQLTGQRVEDMLRSLPQMNPALAYVISAMMGTPLGGRDIFGTERGRQSGWGISGGAGRW
jgi:hypothetical protein